MRVTYRDGAKNLYIYLEGGGACWSTLTCGCRLNGTCHGGTARHLSRPPVADSVAGWRDPTDPTNPIDASYNLVEVPYCTGDAFTGNRIVNYGTARRPILLRHFGYHDLTLALAETQRRFPMPDKVVFMGSSAGALGVTYNVDQVRHFYPDEPLYVISDSGTPFMKPHVWKKHMASILKTWGTDLTLPPELRSLGANADFGDMLRYNAEKYPNHRFALLSSYRDKLMTGFALLLGSSYPLRAVRRTIIDAADHFFGPNQKAFYVAGLQHVFTFLPPDSVQSRGVTLGDWTRAMLNDDPAWDSIRPDLYGEAEPESLDEPQTAASLDTAAQ